MHFAAFDGLCFHLTPILTIPDSSGEFEDSGEEDTSMDADLQKVDDQLQGVLPMYDHRVGTVNFGSRGMTDKRNDFLEGTSGSRFGSPATSAPASTMGKISELLGFIPTGLRVLGEARVDALNQKLDDVRIVSWFVLQMAPIAYLTCLRPGAPHFIPPWLFSVACRQ